MVRKLVHSIKESSAPKMPLFGKSQKSPAEVVKALKEAVSSLEKGDKKLEKVC